MSGRISYLGGIVKNGLILDLDAAKQDSYPRLGTSWKDISGNGNNGTLTNFGSQTIWNSNNGGSIIFDGTNDFVDCGYTVGKPSKFTISTWIKPITYGNCGIVFSSNSGGGQASTHWGLWGRVSGNLEIYISNDSTYQFVNTNIPWSSVGVPNNLFTNIMVTVDGLNIKIFKNSIQSGVSVSQTIQNSGTAYLLCLGKNPADSGYFYNGNISSTQIYNVSLTSQEVLQNYNATKGRYL